MVITQFNKIASMLPSPEDILYGIIKAQVNEFMSGDFQGTENFIPVISNYTDVWSKIFLLTGKAEMKTPLTKKILGNSSNDFVKTLIYIYSM